MNALYSTKIYTPYGFKNISVYAEDVLNFSHEIDILTTSAFYRSYSPTPRTLFYSLYLSGIDMQMLADNPFIDLREACNIWLSKELYKSNTKIKRIGCIEMTPYTFEHSNFVGREQEILNSIKAYFKMLDIAAISGVKIETIAMPLLGAGNQNISKNLTLIPIINECVDFLKRNAAVKNIFFIDINPANAFHLAHILSNSYSLFIEKAPVHKENLTSNPLVFISYSSKDKNVADNLCFKLESRGIKVWYAPRNINGDYATNIANAIKRATYFVIILSENSLNSQHVLNEVDLAFKGLPNNIIFKPLRIDTADFAPAFQYYLSRQHWMDAHLPPLETRLDEFVDTFFSE